MSRVYPPVNVATARRLLDFSVRLPEQAQAHAEEQLRGAVALHNLLCQHRVAYLADEVGLGKTFTALGVMALFRHFEPSFRVLFLSPRAVIQRKWLKEYQNFLKYNVRVRDMRVKDLEDRPLRPPIYCDSLRQLVRDATLYPEHDLFVRMTSFSVAVSDHDTLAGTERLRLLRDDLRRHLPWIPADALDLRKGKQGFKKAVGHLLCCALPHFDLVVVDEAHNLKHGFKEDGSTRNLVLGTALGSDPTPPEWCNGYGPRAGMVLFLSATPVEDTYEHLFNQLDLFGKGSAFTALKDPLLLDEHRKQAAASFLIRRVTSVEVNGERKTRNLYRREWRHGGLCHHDEPIQVSDPRKRLTVALVQKKVSELLSDRRQGNAFQIGMLASFESFLETAGVRRADGQPVSNFDGEEQTRDERERRGLDVRDVNQLARSYRKIFGREMAHPKMDALVDQLTEAWATGKKALVFVRRIASVRELERRLNDSYDDWILGVLRSELPKELVPQLEQTLAQYRSERGEVQAPEAAIEAEALGEPQLVEREADIPETDDEGGIDNFFAWFFRGEGPKELISGGQLRRRFERSGVYATFFEDNRVASLLRCAPERVMSRLAELLGVNERALEMDLQERAGARLPRVGRPTPEHLFKAAQSAALELILQAGISTADPCRQWAKVALADLEQRRDTESGREFKGRVRDWLEVQTFFTELRNRPELCSSLWPNPKTNAPDKSYAEQKLRRQIVSSAARLGHAYIDLYLVAVGTAGSLSRDSSEPGTKADTFTEQLRLIQAYLDRLETQMRTPLAQRRWGAWDELEALGQHFDLILDVNLHDIQTDPARAVRTLGIILGHQQPVGGMAGKLTPRLVQQFRMPGYPFVLVTTDLLQEGEDLHTFCSSVYHYGLSWTPSSTEQRVGRLDRIRSQTERRLRELDRPLEGDHMLQVYYPHLADSVERLQVRRVVDRLDHFLEMVTEDLKLPEKETRTIDIQVEASQDLRLPSPPRHVLKTAFPVRDEHLQGRDRPLAVDETLALACQERFQQLATDLERYEVQWSLKATARLVGETRLRDRYQPFTLLLQSTDGRMLVRCISPVGEVIPEQLQLAAHEVNRLKARVGVLDQGGSYNLTVEDDVLLGGPEWDCKRVLALLRRVTVAADSLEYGLLSGADQRLPKFQTDLEKEGDIRDARLEALVSEGRLHRSGGPGSGHGGPSGRAKAPRARGRTR